MKGEIEGKKGPFDALKMLRRIKNLPSGMAQEGSKSRLIIRWGFISPGLGILS